MTSRSTSMSSLVQLMMALPTLVTAVRNSVSTAVTRKPQLLPLQDFRTSLTATFRPLRKAWAAGLPPGGAVAKAGNAAIAVSASETAPTLAVSIGRHRRAARAELFLRWCMRLSC